LRAVNGPRRLRFGFSPCPNDTFAFWAAAHGVVPSPIELVPELADIEALNERALAGGDAPEVTKLSLPALALLAGRYAVLPAGAALGFGCGPLVVCRADSPLRTLADLAGARVAIPGVHTTANLLLRSLSPALPREVVPMRFEQVMPAVMRGDCDAGLVIHEGRFTYRDHGLRALADLGELWERATGGPLPLGVIAARRDLPAATCREVSALLRASVELARASPERPRAWVRAHAQELAADVCDRHIALYVNDFTVDLGERGRRAILGLLARGRATGLLPDGPSPFREDG
jgi:1,4-dihydroxy-6-naphthoate synthase